MFYFCHIQIKNVLTKQRFFNILFYFLHDYVYLSVFETKIIKVLTKSSKVLVLPLHCTILDFKNIL